MAGAGGDGLTAALASTGVGLAGEAAGDRGADPVARALGDATGVLDETVVQAATSASAAAARTRMHA
jgi:hypothetical protein